VGKRQGFGRRRRRREKEIERKRRRRKYRHSENRPKILIFIVRILTVYSLLYFSLIIIL